MWAHRPPSSPAPGCRPEARGARVPSDASWRRGPAGEGRQLGQSVQSRRRAQVLAEDRCQLQKGLQLVPPHPKRQSPISTPGGLRHWNLFPMLFQSVNEVKLSLQALLMALETQVQVQNAQKIECPSLDLARQRGTGHQGGARARSTVSPCSRDPSSRAGGENTGGKALAG